MGYQALLFCPDEKTARTVTQVLSELEFSVEACIEPFAAVKKLMSAHFDAIVVDCDNEQNATLLFKSARNSTSNQASLAVAVVEGQAGVAKAFRIGANLVLTKPINVEQAKGTLRVARGLLRKGEPAKPAASAPTPAPSAPAPAVTAAKPAPPRPVPPLKTTPPAAATAKPAVPRAAVPPAPKPAPSAAWPVPVPAAAAASAAPAAPEPDEDLLEINADKSAPAPKFSAPAVAASPAAPAHAASTMGTFGSGAASAPAPAREVVPHNPEIVPVSAAHEAPAEAAKSEYPSSASAAPTFTFGGANVPAESGNSKKLILIAAAVIVAAGGAYAAWSHFQGRPNQPVSSVTAPAPAAVAPAPKPSSALPAAPKPAASESAPSSGPVATQPDTTPATTSAADESTPDAEAPSSTKTSSLAKATSTKADAATPRVMKGGVVPTIKKAAPAPDAPAPSVIGIATPGSSAPPLDLGNSASGNALAPRLQTMNISQGVSQGLLMKKVQPIYPRTALAMQIEGVVELSATISKTGDITAVKVISGNSQLTKAASDAVKQWKYKPYLLNGEPVEIQTQISIKFALPH